MKKIALVAHNMSPSGCFLRLNDALKKASFSPRLLIGSGSQPPITLDEIPSIVANSDLIVLGMSSSEREAEMEIAVGLAAVSAGKPLGFYADAPHAQSRALPGKWFAPFAEHARFYFGINAEDVQTAQEIFPNALCVETGSPLREEMFFSATTRAKVRKKLEIDDDSCVIHLPGDKFIAGNMVLWMTIAETIFELYSLYKSQRTVLVITPHPGDPAMHLMLDGKAHNPYDELVQNLPVQARFVPKSVMPSSDVLVAADLLIEFSTSMSIEAAMKRIPVITLTNETRYCQYERSAGGRDIESISQGTSIAASLSDRVFLAQLMLDLCNDNARSRELLRRQKDVYPAPKERGLAVAKMVETIKHLLA